MFKKKDKGKEYKLNWNEPLFRTMKMFAELMNFKVEDIEFVLKRKKKVIKGTETPAELSMINGDQILASGKVGCQSAFVFNLMKYKVRFTMTLILGVLISEVQDEHGSYKD